MGPAAHEALEGSAIASRRNGPRGSKYKYSNSLKSDSRQFSPVPFLLVNLLVNNWRIGLMQKPSSVAHVRQI
eukprot:7132367-Pyramimonas_sp.AAC.1